MEIIHIVLGKANPQRMNGVNKVVYNLATEQTRAGISVSVWGITSGIEHNYPERNFKTVLFQKKRFPFAVPDNFLEAIRNSSESAVFHIHGGFIPVFYSIAKLLRKENRKFVFTPHGSYNKIAWKKSPVAKAVYFNVFEKQMLSRASLIHVLGKSETDGLNSLCKGFKIQRIPYGFEPELSNHVNYSNPSEFIVGFCGRLDVYTKGLDALLEGFALFSAKNQQAVLWLIGDGSEKSKLITKAAKLNITDKVCFWGSRFGTEKDSLIAQMQVFAHPSRNEGLPTAVLEAASLGVPCLISEATNLGDEIRASGAGLVIPETNKDMIASGLEQLYQSHLQKSPELIQVISKNMVSQYFSWKNILNEFNRVYNSALS